MSWSYLPRNSFKFNTDVSSFGNPGRSGFGGVICDFLANWVVGYSGYYGFIMNMATELHAIWYSVKLDFNSSLSHFVCELDSSSGLGLLYEGCIPTHPQAALVHKIKFLSEVTYGKPPLGILAYLPGSSSVEVVDFLLTSRQQMFETLR